MSRLDFPVSLLRERLEVFPDEGTLRWKYCARMGNNWNSRFAGKIAGCRSVGTYRTISIDSVKISVHQIIFAMVHGYFPENVDHINGIRHDNRIQNLRAATRRTNARNAAKRCHNTSGYNGVSWDSKECKWAVRLTVDTKTIYLGRFSDLNEAVKIRLLANKRYGFSDRHGQ